MSEQTDVELHGETLTYHKYYQSKGCLVIEQIVYRHNGKKYFCVRVNGEDRIFDEVE